MSICLFFGGVWEYFGYYFWFSCYLICKKKNMSIGGRDTKVLNFKELK